MTDPLETNPIYDSVCQDLGYRPKATRIEWKTSESYLRDSWALEYAMYSRVGMEVLDPNSSLKNISVL